MQKGLPIMASLFEFFLLILWGGRWGSNPRQLESQSIPEFVATY
jgi:hypothetical protein